MIVTRYCRWQDQSARMDTDNIRIQKQKPSQGRAFIFTTSLHYATKDHSPHQAMRTIGRTNGRDRMRLLLFLLQHALLQAKFFAAKSQFTMFQYASTNL